MAPGVSETANILHILMTSEIVNRDWMSIPTQLSRDWRSIPSIAVSHFLQIHWMCFPIISTRQAFFSLNSNARHLSESIKLGIFPKAWRKAEPGQRINQMMTSKSQNVGWKQRRQNSVDSQHSSSSCSEHQAMCRLRSRTTPRTS